jgi:hypothetical protein
MQWGRFAQFPKMFVLHRDIQAFPHPRELPCYTGAPCTLKKSLNSATQKQAETSESRNASRFSGKGLGVTVLLPVPARRA